MAHVEIVGLKEFTRTLRAAKDRELDRRIGQANKRVGEFVINRLTPRPDPRAVGAGRGSDVRPSASKREVLLRVGGGHRVPVAGPPSPGSPPRDEIIRMNPWGIKRVARPGTPTPDRPFIAGTVEKHFDDIGALWLKATMDALDPAFAERR